MPPLPAPVQALLENLAVQRLSAAYLRTDDQGRIVEAGGQLAGYGIGDLMKGDDAGSKAHFLAGLLPFDGGHDVFPCLETAAGVFADVHVLSAPQGNWVVLLDVTEAARNRQLLQQKGNELSLLRQRQAQMLDQYLGREIADRLSDGIFAPGAGGERKEVTVLFADVRGFTTYSQTRPPEQVFANLNAYVRAMIDPILDEGGLVDKLIGDAVMAIFGALEPTRPEHAVRAAMSMIQRVRTVASQRDDDFRPEVGIGIATGPVALGILGSRERRSFTAIGHHVNLAARLEGQARAGEIVIDQSTFDACGEMRARFHATKLTLKGVSAPVKAFTHLLK
jgi:class 3 adenylate cyclase